MPNKYVQNSQKRDHLYLRDLGTIVQSKDVLTVSDRREVIIKR